MKTTQDAIDQEYEYKENLAKLVIFLAWAREEDEIYGGISAKEALASLAFMLDCTESSMDEVATSMINDFFKS